MLMFFRLLFFAAILIILGGSPALAQDDANRADIGFVGLHGGVFAELEKHAPPLQLRLRYFEDQEISEESANFAKVQVLYIQHVREEDRDAYQKLLQRAKQDNPQLKIICFQPSAAEFFRSIGTGELLSDDTGAKDYYGSSSENLRRFLIYTGVKFLGRQGTVEPPEPPQQEGLYHPDHEGLFRSASEFVDWHRSRFGDSQGKPRVLIAVHQAHLVFQQPKVVDALVREVEKQGGVGVAIIDGRNPRYEVEAKNFAPSVMIHTCHSADRVPFRSELNVPHLHAVFIRKQSIAEWEKSDIGLAPSELAFHVVGQELIGGIEPHVVAGTNSSLGGADAFIPIPDRVQHLVQRSITLAKLASIPISQKKIAVVYYDREMGKGELMRGSSTGMHMNAPRSLLNVLVAMEKHGYRLQDVPSTESELLDLMMNRGRQVGVWAPAELDRLVRSGSPILVPTEQYELWLRQKVPADRIKQLEEKWGPAPGNFMVWEDKGKKFIVIPRISLGNVILLPQPLRGELHSTEEANLQAHDKTTTPPHNYLATYFWLEKEYGANALIHFGTHGSEFALPGKPTGLGSRDWCDIIMGSMPNFNPWIIENIVESSPVRRRVYGTLISHLSPPIVNAGLSDQLATLHETLDKWEVLEEGPLKDKFREEIARQAREAHIEKDLGWQIAPQERLSDLQLEEISKYLHRIQEETTPTSLHVYGEPPREDLLVPYMVTILRNSFLKSLAKLQHENQHQSGIEHAHDHQEDVHGIRPTAERIVAGILQQHLTPLESVNVVLGTKLAALPEDIQKSLELVQKLEKDFALTGNEVANLLSGLDGKFVPPGPGNSPVRNPSAVPTGRNMYLLNPEEVPTRPSWELGKKLADELIEAHRKKHGTFPTKIGFDLRSSATFRDYGVMEAQILYLMGVEPIWDERLLVNDVKLIPREELGRPRVDVFIAAGSWYESNLPSRLELWDKAVRLVTQLDEPDNPLYQNHLAVQAQLIQAGVDPQRAAMLSQARIFGRDPNREQGSFLSYKVAQSGNWEDREEIAAQYLAAEKHVFTKGAWGEEAHAAYNLSIQGTHTVVRSWSDQMTSPLSSKYTWLHGGGLSMAVEAATGKQPDYVLSDVRDADQAEIVDAEHALRREYRVRMFNRKWLEGMMKEGYAGADHIRVLTSNSFGWEVMRPGSVGNDNWNEMKALLVDDKLNLNLREWMENANPYAYQDSLAVMMEAARKGYWKAGPSDLQEVAVAYAQNVAQHGMSGHITSGGNAKLDQLVQKTLRDTNEPRLQELLVKYASRVEEQSKIPSSQLPNDSLAKAPPKTPATAEQGPAPGNTEPLAASNASPTSIAESGKSNPVAEEKASQVKPPVEAQERVENAVSLKPKSELKSDSNANEEEVASPWTLAVGIAVAMLFVFGVLFSRGSR